MVVDDDGGDGEDDHSDLRGHHHHDVLLPLDRKSAAHCGSAHLLLVLVSFPYLWLYVARLLYHRNA